MATLIPLRPKHLVCLLILVMFVVTVSASAVEPPTRPFPRIEAEQHTGPITCIAVDAKGRWLVTASNDKTARIWDLDSGNLVRVLRPPIGKHEEGRLHAAALSPDGRTIAVGGWTGAEWEQEASVYLFDRATGVLRQRIRGLPSVILYLAFSADGKRLAAALSHHGIRIYRSDTWAEIGQDTDYGHPSLQVAFDLSGRLASTCLDGFIRLYNRDLKLIAKEKVRGGANPFSLAFSPDGQRIAVGFEDTTVVRVLSAEDLSLLYTPDSADADNGNLGSVTWSQDGQTLFAGGQYGDSQGNTILMSWPAAGRDPAREQVISKSTISGLIPLADGRLVFGAMDPAWGLLDRSGERIRGRGPAIADFRLRNHEIRLSVDGTAMEVDFKVLNAEDRWEIHVMRFDLSERRMTLNPPSDTAQLQHRLAAMGFAPGPADGVMGPRTRKALEAFQRERGLAVTGEINFKTRESLGLPSLTGPRTSLPGLQVTDWWDNNKQPKLDGKTLDLEQFETSYSLDIAQDGRRFLLGTSWYLRLYDRQGNLVWRTPAPTATMMVNLSANGRWTLAAFHDGSIRWFDAVEGRERLTLFVDGGAIAGNKRRGSGPSAELSPVPWVLWTPEGFFDAAGGGDRLMGWHMNRGAAAAAELVDASQIGEVFRRPDLVARALEADYPQLAKEALTDIGDLKQLLAQGHPPGLERLGPAAVRQAKRTFRARFRVEDRGGGVGRIEYRVNGVVMGEGDFRGRFGLGLPNRREESRPFTLDAGRHRIEARAFDDKGRLASAPAIWEVEITGQGRLPALYGLAVGIGPYKDRSLDLKYADDDARAFAEVLQKATAPMFREVDVKPLVNQDASLAGITAAFEAMAARAGPEDVFVLFLAGHGLVVEGRYHFIPHDLIYTNRRALAAGSLTEDRLRDLLAKVQAQKSLVVIDSCYAGAALGDKIQLAAITSETRTRGQSIEEKAAIDRLMAKTGRAVLASSTQRQFAMEGFKGHGVFTYVLLEGLRGHADLYGDRDGTIETSELADYIEDEVPRISRRVWKYEQYPMRNLQGQSFPIGLRPKAP